MNDIPLSAPAERLYAELSERFDLKISAYDVGTRTVKLAEIRQPHVLLDQLIECGSEIDLKDERLPYWAELWPAALTVAGHLTGPNGTGPDNHVLEIGCGLGLAGIAAGLTGANVRFTDYQPDALQLATLNWHLNCHGDAQTELMDWRSPNPQRQYDTIVAADVAYEARFFEPLETLFGALLTADGRVILGEPKRIVAGPFYLLLKQRGWQVSKHEKTIMFRGKETETLVCELRRKPDTV